MLSPSFKEKKKDKFITQYENTGRDLNIDSLYNAVTGENISGDAILDTVVTTEQRSRKPVEEFCARLKKIFVMGIIAVMGSHRPERGSSRRGHSEEMAGSHGRSRDTHESGGGWLHWEFPSAGQGGCGASNSGGSSQHWPRVHWISTGYTCEEILLGFLVSSGLQSQWHILLELARWQKVPWKWRRVAVFFDLLTENNIRIVVSFSSDPKPINKSQIVDLIETQKLKGNMQSVAQSLWEMLPNTVVHAISRYKKVEEKNNFQPECFYFGKHKKAHLCIHSE